MTKEKAIKHLEIMKNDYALMGDIEALNMAINALSNPKEELEKIKAEIEALIYYVGEPPYSLIEVVNVETVLEIIDKHIGGKK